ncbi:hypothetical protein BD309DRAFT_972133 [Dichomitus squalens]|nr:hypothetical protein BD309DRAFT_972133 [Dichomitus squalens]
MQTLPHMLSSSRQLLLSSSVVLYDTVLTMAPEARIMWRRRLHFIDFLYFVNRYGQVAYALINIISFAPYNYKVIIESCIFCIH